MFILRRQVSAYARQCPAVGLFRHIATFCRQEWFDGDDHAFFQNTFVFAIEVTSDVAGFFVQRAADTVTAKIFNDPETIGLSGAFDRCANAIERLTRSGAFHCFEQRGTCCMAETGFQCSGGGNYRGAAGISEVAIKLC